MLNIIYLINICHFCYELVQCLCVAPLPLDDGEEDRRINDRLYKNLDRSMCESLQPPSWQHFRWHKLPFYPNIAQEVELEAMVRYVHQRDCLLTLLFIHVTELIE